VRQILHGGDRSLLNTSLLLVAVCSEREMLGLHVQPDLVIG
jgi:hypothetical protein